MQEGVPPRERIIVEMFVHYYPWNETCSKIVGNSSFLLVPSTTDVLMNVTGTAIGVWLALAIDQIITFCTVRIRSVSA